MRLLSESEAARLHERRGQPAFAAAWTALTANADEALARPVDVPVEGAGWSHDYFCPDHAAQLTHDRDQPQVHRCPVDGHVFTGEPYDSAWRARTNHQIADGAYAAALVWLGTGDRRYAAHTTAVLDAYAARYRAYEVHGTHAGQGRCMGQSLDEATWSIPLAWAYDAIRETLDPARQARIEGELLRPIGEHLLGQLWRRVHNIECWHLAALATHGLVLGEDRFVVPALDPDHGYAAQVRGGVLANGWWWEGSPTYHFYTLNAVLALVMALRQHRPDVTHDPRLRAMFDAPPALARADLSLPALNDGWFIAAERGYLARQAASYEVAYSLWHDPAHGALLARFYASGQPRDTTQALLFGAETLPAAMAEAPASVVQDASGYAVLRGGVGDEERWLLLKYGSHGGGHGHADKLALDLHAFGQPLSPDLGTPGYGIPLNKSWYRHTLAHNTVLIDAIAQPPATGQLLRFVAPADAQGPAGYGVADAVVAWPDDASAPYAGVTLRRCVLWKPGPQPYFIDLVLASCPQPRQIDLVWHHRGAAELPAAQSADAPGNGDGYDHLNGVQEFTGGEWIATWRGNGAGTRCWALDPPETAVYAARAPYNPAAEAMALLLRRVTAATPCFAAVFEPFVDEPAIHAVRWVNQSLADGGWLGLSVEHAAGRDGWLIAPAEQLAALDRAPFAGTTLHEYRLAGPDVDTVLSPHMKNC